MDVDGGGPGPTSWRIQAFPDSSASQGHAEHPARVRGRLGRDRKFRWHARLRFSTGDRRRYQRTLSRGRMCGWILRIDRHGDHAASPDVVLLRNVWQAARPRTWRPAAAANADQDRLPEIG